MLGMFLVTSVIGFTRGQITSNTADHLDSLSYPVNEGKDPLFVFYQTNGVHKPGSLTTTLPGTGNYSFEWSKYNPALNGFDPPFSTDSGRTSSSVTDLADGGYRVRIFNGTGTDTTMMSWVMLNNFYAGVAKTQDDRLDSRYYTCDRLALIGYVIRDSLVYYDPVSHLELKKVLDYRFKWTSDNEDLKIPNDTIILAPNITYAPPYKDTWYILTATDDLGMVEVDSVFYESIQTKAEFTVDYYDKVTEEYDESLTGGWSKDKGSLDARLTVRFINESLNGATFEWVFLDTLGGIKETETTYDLEEMPEFTYERADEYYYPSMFSISEAGCIDSAKIEEGIFVEPSQLVIPNVFTPNGDGMNDMFVFKHQSLQTCKVTIVDRTGKVAYKMEIDDIYTWDGWDGNMRESDRRAPEGQYYYVVEAMGYDGHEYRDPGIWENMKIFGGPGNNNSSTPPGGTNPGGPGTEAPSETLYTGWLYLFRH